ncbi:hypothetical protein LCGC14_2022490, partial [marine sediment metagenome]
KEFIKLLNYHESNGSSYALETTLSGRTLLNRVRRNRENGYYIKLIYIILDTPELNQLRIASRVARGEHNIPEEVVRRRFERSRHNLWNKYIYLVDEWHLFNNSGELFAPVASGSYLNYNVHNDELFRWFMKGAK